jgi:hypothetical protein
MNGNGANINNDKGIEMVASGAAIPWSDEEDKCQLCLIPLLYLSGFYSFF